MNFKCRNFNLLKLHDSKIWHQLINLTKQNGIAREHFAHIQYSNRSGTKNNYWYKIAKVRCVFNDGRMIAWGLVIQQNQWEARRLWIYTDSAGRGEGIQKGYILPFFKRYYPNCNTQRWAQSQKEAFKYYEE